MYSVFEIFKIGIGPSSSHTVGPMRAARAFVVDLEAQGMLDKVCSVRAELFGSLALTGQGHGTDRAVLLGLMGEDPETIDPDSIPHRLANLAATHRLALLGRHAVDFDPARDLVLDRKSVV